MPFINVFILNGNIKSILSLSPGTSHSSAVYSETGLPIEI